MFLMILHKKRKPVLTFTVHRITITCTQRAQVTAINKGAVAKVDKKSTGAMAPFFCFNRKTDSEESAIRGIIKYANK